MQPPLTPLSETQTTTTFTNLVIVSTPRTFTKLVTTVSTLPFINTIASQTTTLDCPAQNPLLESIPGSLPDCQNILKTPGITIHSQIGSILYLEFKAETQWNFVNSFSDQDTVTTLVIITHSHANP